MQCIIVKNSKEADHKKYTFRRNHSKYKQIFEIFYFVTEFNEPFR